jgi:hypothetical protein
MLSCWSQVGAAAQDTWLLDTDHKWVPQPKTRLLDTDHKWVPQPKTHDCLTLITSGCRSPRQMTAWHWSQVHAAAQDKWLLDTWRWRQYDPSKHLTHTHTMTVSHSSRSEFSATPLSDHQILHCRKAVGHPNQLVLLVIWCGKDKIHNTKCQALIRVLLKMQVFRDTDLCHWMCGYWWIGRCCHLGIHHEVVQEEQWHFPRDTYLQSV